MTTSKQPGPSHQADARLRDSLAQSQLVQALDDGDFDAASQLWDQASSSPDQLDNFYRLAKAWAAEPDTAEEVFPAGPVAADFLAGLPSVGLTGKDLLAHTSLLACRDELPASGGPEKLIIWMRERGIEASREYARGVWRALSGVVTQAADVAYMLAARQADELPPKPPEPPPADGPVR
jgi:hypothetical protein